MNNQVRQQQQHKYAEVCGHTYTHAHARARVRAMHRINTFNFFELVKLATNVFQTSLRSSHLSINYAVEFYVFSYKYFD